MGRQSQSIEAASGGDELRLDPAALPQRFRTPDGGSEGGLCDILLEKTRVLLTRRLGGVAMKIAVPIAAYRGVVVRILAGAVEPPPIEVALVHQDRALDVPLWRATDDRAAVSEWRRWSGALDLPLLFERFDGSLVTLERRSGTVAIGPSHPRRPRVSRERLRPRFLRRRRIGRPLPHQMPPR